MTHVEKANEYARAIDACEIIACKWVRLACKRHIDDKARSSDPEYPFEFDKDKANDICVFAEKLPHIDGIWASENIILEPWQCFILCSLFGWVKKSSGMRRFRKACIYVPRKNAKSTLSAIIGWWMLAKDGEKGAQILCGATSLEQASHVFRPAQEMGRQKPNLLAATGALVAASAITVPSTNSAFRPMIGMAKDGGNPHLAVLDEYHEHKTSALHDSMKTGMGARRQSLLLVISTAGSNLAGPCRDDWKKCEKVLDGHFDDPSLFAIIYTIDDEDKWTSEESLRKANPNWGVSVLPDTVLPDLKSAKETTAQQAAFKTKHLNLWVTTSRGFFNVETWRSLADPSLKIEDMIGNPCTLGFDLAIRHDLTALMACFRLEDRWALFGRYYISEDEANRPENAHFRKWAKDGLLKINDGGETDLMLVEDDCAEMYNQFGASLVAYDPEHAAQMAQRLQSRGVNMVNAYGNVQTSKMPEWLASFDGALRSGKLVHNGDPLLEWAVSNAVSKPGKRGMFWLDKENVKQKIDPIVAAVMAFGISHAEVPVGPGVWVP